MRSSNEYVDAQWTRRPGPRPILLSSPASHTQVDLVCEHILELLGKESCRLADIAILCLDNRSCESCKDILNGKGLRAVQQSDTDFDILEEQIKVMTIHSAKGLEFPIVFLLGLTEGDFPRPYALLCWHDTGRRDALPGHGAWPRIAFCARIIC